MLLALAILAQTGAHGWPDFVTLAQRRPHQHPPRSDGGVAGRTPSIPDVFAVTIADHWNHGDSVSPPLPNGWQAGDLMVVAIFQPLAESIEPPAGWTRIYDGSTYGFHMFWHRAQLGDLNPSFVVNPSSAVGKTAMMLTLRNTVDTGDPIEALRFDVAGATPISMGTLTSTVPLTRFIYAAANYVGIVNPGNFSELATPSDGGPARTLADVWVTGPATSTAGIGFWTDGHAEPLTSSEFTQAIGAGDTFGYGYGILAAVKGVHSDGGL